MKESQWCFCRLMLMSKVSVGVGKMFSRIEKPVGGSGEIAYTLSKNYNYNYN